MDIGTTKDQYAIPRWMKVSRAGLDTTHAARVENNVVPPHALEGAPPPKEVFNVAKGRATFKRFVLDKYDEMVKAGKVYRPRKDQVLAIEGLLTASPEFFRPDAPGEAGKYTERSVSLLVERGIPFLKARHGDNLIRVELQLDEVTPHLQYAFLPIDDRGMWSAKNCMKRRHLRALWDDWAAVMKDLGLKRGLEGSIGRHEPIRTFYGAINRFESSDRKVGELVSIQPPTLVQPSKLDLQDPANYIGRINNQLTDWAKKEAVRIQESLRPTVAAAVSSGLSRRRSATDRKTTERAIRRLKRLETELADLRKKFPEPISVAAVRKHLGHLLASAPAMEYDAFKYLEQTEGLNFKSAMGWLTAEFGAPAATATAAEVARANALALVPKHPHLKPKKITEIRDDLNSQLSALQADRFQIVVRKQGVNAGKWELHRKPNDNTTDWSIEEFLFNLPHLRVSLTDHEIKVVPVSSSYKYVLVSGLTYPYLLGSLSLTPCNVLNVATDSYEAVLRIPAGSDDAELSPVIEELEKSFNCSVVPVVIDHPLALTEFRLGVRANAATEVDPLIFCVELVAAIDVDFMKLPELPFNLIRPDLS